MLSVWFLLAVLFYIITTMLAAAGANARIVSASAIVTIIIAILAIVLDVLPLVHH